VVGYSTESIKAVGAVLDRVGADAFMARQKVTASFYKIMMGDFDTIITHKKEIASLLMIMMIMHIRKDVKHEAKTAVKIAEEVLIPMMNRALYEQASVFSALSRPNDIPMLQIMSMDVIGKGHLEKVISMIMILTKTDFQDLLMDDSKMEYYIRDKRMFRDKTFISLEDVVDASNNYNAQ